MRQPSNLDALDKMSERKSGDDAGAMASPTGDTPTQHGLAVRLCCILDREGRTNAHASVYCLRRERSVRLEVCAGCEAAAGLALDAAGNAIALCRLPSTEAADSGAPTRREGTRRDAELADKLSIPVADIMTTTALCARPEMPLDALRSTLLEHGFGGLPVVDDEGRLVGLISMTDLLRAAEEPRRQGGAPADDGTVASLMTQVVAAVHERSSIAHASALMAYEAVHRLPVVDDDGHVVGVLSALDVLHWLGEQAGYLMRPIAPHQP